MSSSVFRKSSIEKVSSPEQLNDYIKVSNPSVWMVLIATIILLIGVVVWGIFGTLTTTQDTVAVAQEGDVVCLVLADNIDEFTVGMEVQIGNCIGKIIAVSQSSPVQVGQNFDPYIMYLGGFKVGNWVYPVQVQIVVEEGVYPAQILIEKTSPISFILN